MLYDFDPFLTFPPTEHLVYRLKEQIVQSIGGLAVQISHISFVDVNPGFFEVCVAVYRYEDERDNRGEPQHDEQPLSGTLKHSVLSPKNQLGLRACDRTQHSSSHMQ